MKILAIDNEGHVHAAADSAVVTRSQPWFEPDGGAPWHGELYIAAIVSRLGKGVAERFARRYYDRVAVVVHPSPAIAGSFYEWTRDGAVLAGDHIPVADLADKMELHIGETSYPVDVSRILGEFDKLLSDITEHHTIKTGDMLMLPLAGIPPVALERPLTLDITLGVTRVLRLKVR